MEVTMRKMTIPALLALGLSLMLATSCVYAAASVDDVVAACDHMNSQKAGSCTYEVDGGGLHGCTANVCFNCPADGKRQCYAMRKSGKGPDAVIGTVKMKCEPVINGWCQQALEAGQPAKPAGR
jgi:hypothetical protein